MARKRQKVTAANHAREGEFEVVPVASTAPEREHAATVADHEGAAETRRDQMAAIARKRAAHFAHFQVEDEDQGVDNAHVGGNEARNLGPWSSARQLVEARAKAAADRADKHKVKPVTEDTASLQVSWSPSRDVKLWPPGPSRVDSLVVLMLRLLADHIEDVESLWGLPDVLRVKLAAVLAEKRKLGPEAAKLFVEGLPGELVLPECTQLEEPHFIQLLAECAGPRLERVDLRHCGRGMGDSAAAALANQSQQGKPGLPALSMLNLGGAYRLTPAALRGILENAPALSELHLPNCSRLEGPALHALPALVPGLRVLDLANCRGLGTESLRGALATSPGLPQLHTLTLDGLPELCDSLLSDITLMLPLLTRLSLFRCGALTDVGLRGIAAACPGLLALQLGDVGRVTDSGLHALVQSCIRLEELSLTRCQKVTDAPLVALAAHRCLRHLCINNVVAVTDATIVALATHCMDTLEEVDASWCRSITGRALGMLADACPKLHTLRLFGCSQVDATFLQGHSNLDLEVVGAPAQKVSKFDSAKAKLICQEAG